MESKFEKVKNYILDLEYTIVTENKEDKVLIIEKETDAIKNMIIACADPILILEQNIFELKRDDKEIYKALLMKNRDIIHGAFVYDENSNKVLFRDTLQIENLDRNELEGSLNSLSLLLSEFSNEILKFSK